MNPFRTSSASVRSRAFSLVEVAMALGIFSFAVLGLLGLLPAAVTTHKEAKLSTVLSQIRQRLAAEVLLTDGAKLASLNGFTRSFDNEGRELTAEEADNEGSNRAVYRAKIQIENFLPPGAAGNSQSLQRVVLFAVQDPLGTSIGAAKPSGSMLIPRAESFAN